MKGGGLEREGGLGLIALYLIEHQKKRGEKFISDNSALQENPSRLRVSNLKGGGEDLFGVRSVSKATIDSSHLLLPKRKATLSSNETDTKTREEKERNMDFDHFERSIYERGKKFPLGKKKKVSKWTAPRA